MTERFEQHAFAPPPDAREVILVRHGASAPYVPGEDFSRIDGHGDPPLAAAGEAQAERVARRLAGEPLAARFVTSLQRTAQTAAPLAARCGLEPEVLRDLREIHLGDWEGGEYRVRLARRDPVAYRMLQEERWDVIPGAEPMQAFTARVKAGMEALLERVQPGQVVAAFLHAAVIGELCRQATGSRPFAFIHVDNGSLSRLVVLGSGRWLLRSFNDVAHLTAG